jgi:hypothetical protein
MGAKRNAVATIARGPTVAAIDFGHLIPELTVVGAIPRLVEVVFSVQLLLLQFWQD